MKTASPVPVKIDGASSYAYRRNVGCASVPGSVSTSVSLPTTVTSVARIHPVEILILVFGSIKGKKLFAYL